jgi:tetratricopeptide (TPR) repeat protein
MSIELIERQQALASLSSAFASACAGAGRTVLLSGEAGIGKSSITHHFLAGIRSHVRVFIGGCEVLSTPRPLGPVQDFAGAMGGRVLQLLREGDKSAWIAQALLAELSTAQMTVLVFEDVHWADHSTLDLLKYIGRRIGPLNALLFITYRDDEIPHDHPLHSVLADLPATSTSRISLKPLSRDAVDILMKQSGRSIPRLYQVTRGNPFFVNAMLAVPDEDGRDVIASVQDMVLARLRRLGEAARELCEVVSVVPAQIEYSVLVTSQLMPEHELTEALDGCVLAGLLEQDAVYLRFRHELARQVIESSLSTNRARVLHARVFHALLDAPAISVARLVHHASKARLADKVLEYAPKAAAEARRLGAHREALTYYDHLRVQLTKAPRRTQAEILEGWAFSYAAVAWANEQVFQALEQAVLIWRELLDLERAGIALRLLAFGYWITGDRAQSVARLDEAIELLESIAPTAALAIAYSMKTKVFLAEADISKAIAMGRRAISLSEELGDHEARAHALTYLGTALLRAEQSEGALVLAEGIALGRTHGLHESTTDAYHNLTETLVKQ